MFDIRNLSIVISKNSVEIIKNFNLSIKNNTKLAIIGEEGNGKSTLVKAICGVDISSYAVISGNINVHGVNVGYLPQSFEDDELEMNARDFLTWDANAHEFNYAIFNEYGFLSKLINDFNLDLSILDSDKKLTNYSGGERLKIALIKILCKEPDILIFDEPTNDLDLDALKFLERFIISDNRPIIFVSHDEKLLENTANAILHLERLKKKTESKWTLKSQSYAEFLEERRHTLERQDQIAGNERAKFEAKMERFRRIQERVNHDLNSVSRQDPHSGRLLAKKMKTVKAQEKRFEKERENLPEFSDSEEAIHIEFGSSKVDKNRIIHEVNIDKLQIGDRLLASNINFKVLGRDKIVIVGKNGCGKSTLIKKIYDDLAKVNNLNVKYLSQDITSTFDGFETVIDFINENMYEKHEKTRTRTFLGSLKLTDEEVNSKIESLSGGTKVKLALAKIMVEGADVLVLDEPTRNLSPLSNPVLRSALHKYNGAIIAVSHDRKFIEEVANKVLAFENGKIVDVTDKYQKFD